MTDDKHQSFKIAADRPTATPARADLVLSQLIIDLQQGQRTRKDVEVWNNGPERSFVAVEPREIVNPGLPSPCTRVEPDPEKLGLLASPARLVLEPGQRRPLRIGTLIQDIDHEPVYRATVKPVAGAVQSAGSGLKIIVGSDVLVLVRPAAPKPKFMRRTVVACSPLATAATSASNSLTAGNVMERRRNASICQASDCAQGRLGQCNCLRMGRRNMW